MVHEWGSMVNSWQLMVGYSAKMAKRTGTFHCRKNVLRFVHHLAAVAPLVSLFPASHSKDFSIFGNDDGYRRKLRNIKVLNLRSLSAENRPLVPINSLYVIIEGTLLEPV